MEQAKVFDIESARQGEHFLRTIFMDKPDDTAIALWTLNNKRTHYYKNPPKQASIKKLAENDDLYFALGLQASGRTGNRAPAREVKGITCLWADVDYLCGGDIHKKKNLPESLDQAIELVRAMPFIPTFLVHSGHGLHAYWIFKEPWIFEGDDWKKAEGITRRWNHLLAVKAKERGWVVDSVFDLARILRVPGTKNFKDRKNPVPCTVLEYSPGAFVEIGDVEEVLPALAEPTPDKPEKTPASPKGDYGFILRHDATPPAEKLEVLKENDPEFAQMWAMKKKPKNDDSPSGWDMMLAHKFCAARWDMQEIVDSLLFFRRVIKKVDDKLNRPDYYYNTVVKARSYYRRQGAAEKLGQIQDERLASDEPLKDLTETQREEVLQNLREILRVDIQSIEKYLEDPPLYFLQTSQGSMQIGTVDKLVSQTQFRYVLAASCNVAIPFFKSKEWSGIVQSVLDICTPVEVGDESSDEGVLTAYLKDYISTLGRRIGHDKDRAFIHKIPFQIEDRIAFFGTKFLKWLKMEQLGAFGLKQMNRLLYRIGAEQRKMNFWPQGGKRTTGLVWLLPYGPFRDFLVENENEEE